MGSARDMSSTLDDSDIAFQERDQGQGSISQPETSQYGAKVTRKWCFVPGCKNTSSTTPKKIFLNVPRDLKRRRLWARLARREDAGCLTARNVWYCCEDHFDVSICMYV